MIPLLITLALLQTETVALADSSKAESAATLLIDEVRRIGARVEALRNEPFARPLDAVRVPDDIREAAAVIRVVRVVRCRRIEPSRGEFCGDFRSLADGRGPRRLVCAGPASVQDGSPCGATVRVGIGMRNPVETAEARLTDRSRNTPKGLVIRSPSDPETSLSLLHEMWDHPLVEKRVR